MFLVFIPESHKESSTHLLKWKPIVCVANRTAAEEKAAVQEQSFVILKELKPSTTYQTDIQGLSATGHGQPHGKPFKHQRLKDALQCDELHTEEPASRDGSVKICQPELHKTAPLGTETLHGTETNEAPAVDSCHEDLFLSVTEREIAISGQEDAESNQVMCVDEMILLESCKGDSHMNNNVANGPFSVELAQNEDSSSQMEVEGSINLDIFSAKLLDHPYCKSPLEEPLPESTGLKSGTRKGGRRNSQKVSRVADEQLSTWICGILFTRYKASHS
ncbi:Sentrin-specific protease 5 [Chelonia mydas]|uniref:Sentrin-specific protease 5 n=1 Tax=Chelonia mydas TaxID=8469 RepID=M7AQB9_CHEMY|nr:Sentrin-specific protease 5 [Chelonia mydas]